MHRNRIPDEDRLSEVGAILAQGALRIIISNKHKSSSKSATCRNKLFMAHCESGEKFVRKKS